MSYKNDTASNYLDGFPLMKKELFNSECWLLLVKLYSNNTLLCSYIGQTFQNNRHIEEVGVFQHYLHHLT
jgi:hypothetical protein